MFSHGFSRLKCVCVCVCICMYAWECVRVCQAEVFVSTFADVGRLTILHRSEPKKGLQKKKKTKQLTYHTPLHNTPQTATN